MAATLSLTQVTLSVQLKYIDSKRRRLVFVSLENTSEALLRRGGWKHESLSAVVAAFEV